MTLHLLLLERSILHSGHVLCISVEEKSWVFAGSLCESVI